LPNIGQQRFHKSWVRMQVARSSNLPCLDQGTIDLRCADRLPGIAPG
jgi:hypothetical protein